MVLMLLGLGWSRWLSGACAVAVWWLRQAWMFVSRISNDIPYCAYSLVLHESVLMFILPARHAVPEFLRSSFLSSFVS